MDKTILIATEKPFSAETINIIRQKIDQATGFNLSLLEGYTTKSELLHALKGVDGLVVRSDKVNAEIINNEIVIVKDATETEITYTLAYSSKNEKVKESVNTKSYEDKMDIAKAIIAIIVVIFLVGGIG